MPYDNIKSHKKPGFHPLFRRYIFRKTTEGVGCKAALGLTVSELYLITAIYVQEYISENLFSVLFTVTSTQKNLDCLNLVRLFEFAKLSGCKGF